MLLKRISTGREEEVALPTFVNVPKRETFATGSLFGIQKIITTDKDWESALEFWMLSQGYEVPSKDVRFLQSTTFKLNSYSSALMGFDFADAATLQMARERFAEYLVETGVDEELAKQESRGLNRSWEFATYAFCPTGEGGGIDNSCSATGGINQIDPSISIKRSDASVRLKASWGYVQMLKRGGGWTLNEVYVKPEYRKRGLATELLRAAHKEVGPFKISNIQTQDGQKLVARLKKQNLMDKSGRVNFAFCPTGEGGGIDNSCSPTGGVGSEDNQTEFGTTRWDSQKPTREQLDRAHIMGSAMTSGSPAKYLDRQMRGGILNGGKFIPFNERSKLSNLHRLKSEINTLEKHDPEAYHNYREWSLADAFGGKSYKDLPTEITVYRGAPVGEKLPSATNVTLNRDVAASFGSVTEYRINKKDIGLFIDGASRFNEGELIIFNTSKLKKKEEKQHAREFAGLNPIQAIGKSFMLSRMPPWRGLMDVRPGSPHLKIFEKYVELRERAYSREEFVCDSCDAIHYHNFQGCKHFAFCPTGEGGGIDNSCSPTGEPGGSVEDDVLNIVDIGDEERGYPKLEKARDEWQTKLNIKEKSALGAYRDKGAFNRLNNWLRGGTDIGRRSREVARNLESALAKGTIPNDTMLWRGIRINGEDEASKFRNIKSGATIKEDGFMSLSPSSSIAGNFAAEKADANVLFKLRASSVVGSYVSRPGKEPEVLLQRSAKIKVDKITKRSGGLIFIEGTVTSEKLFSRIDFAESVHYAGDIKDWRDEPLTGESEDESPVKDIAIHSYQKSPYERRVDFAAVKKVLDEDAYKTDLALRVPIRKVLDDLIELIKRQDKYGGISQSFVQSLTLTTGPETQKILGDYLLGIWRKGRDLSLKELPENLRKRIETTRRFELGLDKCSCCGLDIFELAQQDTEIRKRHFVFCPTGEGGGIDPTCSLTGETGNAGNKDEFYVAKINDPITKNNPKIKIDPDNRDNVIVYHATKKIGLVNKNGLKQSRPGVIKKAGFRGVFFAHTPETALAAARYEEELRRDVKGEKPSLGDFWIVRASIPKSEISVRINGDIVVHRDVFPKELRGNLHSKDIRQKQFVKTFAGLEPTQAINFFQNLRPWLIKGIIDDDLKKAARLELTEHLKGGRTLTETIGNLRDAWEPWVGDPTKVVPSGITGMAEDILQAYRLENIIRTETITSLSQGRAAIGDEAGDFVIGYQLSPILDERTTEVCNRIGDLDPFMFRKDDPRAEKLMPALHYQCRTIPVFVTSDDLPIDWSSEAELDSVVRLIPQGFK